MEAQFLAAARGQLAQIKSGRPALVPTQGMFLRFITEIPNLVHRPRQLIELWRGAGILDSVSVCAYHVANANTNHNRSQHGERNFAHENQPGTQRTASAIGRTGRAQFVESGAKNPVRLCHAQRSRTPFGALYIPALKDGAFRARFGKRLAAA